MKVIKAHSDWPAASPHKRLATGAVGTLKLAYYKTRNAGGRNTEQRNTEHGTPAAEQGTSPEQW